jgi:transcriptional regulator with XRE-family HTH domain
MTADAAGMVRRARRAARLTQRDLARLAGVDQAVVARIERGTTIPRADTLTRLLEAAGYGLEAVPVPRPDVDTAHIRALLAMNDRDRERHFLESNRNMLALFRMGVDENRL